ncbi:MAG: hypothetical protein J1G06_08640 [Oscillospiraceae bacterium]|nr:hypothetical protein [Oscillospiraceae bacterium]
MTNEFRELTSRLAKGLNFKGGSMCLITSAEDEDYVNVAIKGCSDALTVGICKTINMMLSQMDDKEAMMARDKIKRQLIADEERWFQRSLIGDESEAE